MSTQKQYHVLQAIIFHDSVHFSITDVEFLNTTFGPVTNIKEYRAKLKEHYKPIHVTKIFLNYEDRSI